MVIMARYVHTNLIARDWQALARFYREIFGCVPVSPERDFAGPDLAAGTGIPGARLPGSRRWTPLAWVRSASAWAGALPSPGPAPTAA